MTSGGNPQSLILCVLEISVVGVAYVYAPNWCSIIYDRSPNRIVSISKVSFCCPQDVSAKALRILFLPDNLSATWLICLLNNSEVDIRRDVCARVENTKQETNEAHSLYGQNPAERRIESRNCFLRSV